VEDGEGKCYCYVTPCSIRYITTLREQTVITFGVEQSPLGSPDSSEFLVKTHKFIFPQAGFVVHSVHIYRTSPLEDKRLEREADQSPAPSAKVNNE
jgi:hypothetical protein